MLPVPFSFTGRIARWPFFKASLALSLSCIIPVMLVIAFAGGLRAGKTAALIGLIVLVSLCAAVVFWIGLTLQTRRCRDIGWNPLLAMVIWAGVQVGDVILAHFAPGLGKGGGTMVGGLFDLGWMLCLTFWPSSDDDGTASPRRPGAAISGLPRTRVEALQRQGTRPIENAADRPASATGRIAFGRR